MSSANVNSFRALLEAKAALDVFIREAVAAVAEADSDLQRTLGWLEREALPHWERVIKQSQQEVEAARSEFYRQQLIANPNTPTALQQRKAWDRAKARLEEAYQKHRVVRRWLTQWEREGALYKGQMSALTEALTHDLPKATARLNRMVELLDQYAALRAPERAEGGAPPETAAAGAPGKTPGQDEAGAHAFAPLDGAPPADAGALPDALALLRARTPPAGLRLATPLTDPAMVVSAPGRVHEQDLGTLERLAIPAVPVRPDQRVSLRSGALASPVFYMERTAPARDDDSGWFLASSGGIMGTDLQAIPAWALLMKRPDLEPLLALPVGSLVSLADHRVQALLDADNTDVWPADDAGASARPS